MRGPASLAKIAAFALLVLPALALARIKVDRYDPATLPEFRLWVTVLDETRPLKPEVIKGFTVYVNGERLEDDADFETAAEANMPMAAGVVADARQKATWDFELQAMQELMAHLPRGSEAFGIATHDGMARIPEDDGGTFPLTDRPETLSTSFQDTETGGTTPYFYRAVKAALQSFPVLKTLEPEPDDGPQPAERGPKQNPFPDDRVLFVLGNGEMEKIGEGKTPPDQLFDLVRMARRRGVRVMAIGFSEDEGQSLWTLRVLARKTGGTFRQAADAGDIFAAAQETTAEMAGRFVLTAESDQIKPGDPVSFSVVAVTTLGENEESRDFESNAEHRMGAISRGLDWISDKWEKAPFWLRAIIVTVILVLIAIIALVITVRRIRRARLAAAAIEEARRAELARRRPCPVCGNLMLPEWKGQCLFCAAPKPPPARFRLTGRAGAWAGQALRFDKDLVTFGAGDHVDVRVPERRVAPEHCGLRDRGNEFILSDFNTELGTFVNGERITQVRLQEGDVIRVGDTELVFGIEAE